MFNSFDHDGKTVHRYDHSILEVVGTLHGIYCGSGDSYVEHEDEILAWLRFRVDQWEPSVAIPVRVRFDNTVLAMCKAVLAEQAEFARPKHLDELLCCSAVGE
jgi:hypothetical protein